MPTIYTNAFEEDVYKGLTSYPKKLSSKYFYDEKGDKIFQQIMNMPEYYLTDAEYSIIESYTEKIAAAFNDENGFDIIELGAGDGKKTKVLLRYLDKNKFNFNYEEIKFYDNESAVDKRIQSLLLLKQCNHFIVTTSTFNWWGAWLSERNDKIILRPSDKFFDNFFK